MMETTEQGVLYVPAGEAAGQGPHQGERQAGQPMQLEPSAQAPAQPSAEQLGE